MIVSYDQFFHFLINQIIKNAMSLILGAQMAISERLTKMVEQNSKVPFLNSQGACFLQQKTLTELIILMLWTNLQENGQKSV